MHESGRDEFDRDDGGVEELLRRYRPIDPPAELRTRILASLREPAVRRAWPWVAAAAALVVSTIASGVAIDGETAKVTPAMTSTVHARARVADDLAELLGGDDTARGLAEFILAEQTARREHDEDTSTSAEGAWP